MKPQKPHRKPTTSSQDDYEDQIFKELMSYYCSDLKEDIDKKQSLLGENKSLDISIIEKLLDQGK